jgi:hypothetical protein
MYTFHKSILSTRPVGLFGNDAATNYNAQLHLNADGHLFKHLVLLKHVNHISPLAITQNNLDEYDGQVETWEGILDLKQAK